MAKTKIAQLYERLSRDSVRQGQAAASGGAFRPLDSRPRLCFVNGGDGGYTHQSLGVAKSALLRFRLQRKLRPLPCFASPHKVSDFAGFPIFCGGTRDAGTKKPLVRMARGYFSISTFFSPLPSSGGCFSFHPSSRAMIWSFI